MKVVRFMIYMIILEACSWYELVIDESNELLESVN